MLLNLFKTLKPKLILEVLSGLHKAEKDEVNGKFPYKFYLFVILIPIVASYFCVVYYPKPKDSFNSSVIQILSIITGLLITSLVPFYEIAANRVLRNIGKSKKEVEEIDSGVDTIRISLMLISYSVIAFSLLLSVLGIVFCLLTEVDFSFMNQFVVNQIYVGKYISKYFSKAIVYFYYLVLLMNLSNLFNIIKYTNSLVIPVFEELKKIQNKGDDN